jgi:hypothetical protein
MKPTTRLLITVVIISFISALVVAAVAIAVSWVNSMTMSTNALNKELSFVMHAVKAFTVSHSRQTLVCITS